MPRSIPASFFAAAIALSFISYACASDKGPTMEVRISKDRKHILFGSELSMAIVEKDTPLVKRIVAEKPQLINKAEGYHKITPLHEASSADNTEAVELLLASGANIEAADRDGLTPLCVSASLRMAELLLAKGARTDVGIEGGKTILHVAAGRIKSGRGLVEFFVKKGMSPNAKDEEGETPLFCAARNSAEAVGVLLDLGADPNVLDKRGRAPLMAAIYSNNVGAASRLIQSGADVNVVPKYGGAPIHYAESTEMVELLVKNGADANSRDASGNTPLFRARKADVIGQLIKNGADVNAQNGIGQTALQDICFTGKFDCVKKMIDSGADPSIADSQSRTPMFSIAACEIYDRDTEEKLIGLKNRIDIIDLLLAKHANVNARDRRGLTPIFDAREPEIADHLVAKGATLLIKDNDGMLPIHYSRTKKMAEYYVSKGMDVNAKDNNGYTPLIMSVVRDPETVEYFLSKGADANAMGFGKRGGCQTPLMAAIDFGREEAVKLLVKNGARVNLKDPGTGNICLHLAAMNKNVKIVEFLLASGADPEARNNLGQTALDVAMEKNNAGIASVLKGAQKSAPGSKK